MGVAFHHGVELHDLKLAALGLGQAVSDELFADVLPTAVGVQVIFLREGDTVLHHAVSDTYHGRQAVFGIFSLVSSSFRVYSFPLYSQVFPANQVPRQLQTAGAFLIIYYLRLFQAVPKPTTPAQSSAASASTGKASPVRGRAPTGRAVFFAGRGIGAALGAGVAVAAGAGGS